MNLADTFSIVFTILGFVIVFISYWLLAAGLFPRMVARCAQKMGEAPVAATLVGAALFLPLVIGGFFGSGKAPNTAGKVFFISIALLALLVALLGSSGLALRIGQGLGSARDAAEPWRRVLRGGIVLALTFVLPVLGTFVLMPFAFIIGFGAFVLIVFRREKQPRVQTESAAIASSEVSREPAQPPLTAAVS